MLLKNARIIDDNFDIVEADILIEGEFIKKIAPHGEINDVCFSETIDLTGKLIMPGFVDIHIHGCAGSDTGDATPEALATMSNYLVAHGVTSFCPTSMTVSNEELRKIFKNVAECKKNGLPGAYIRGINMEGPYIAMSKKGAQRADQVRKPDIAEIRSLNEVAEGLIKLIDIAPEVEGADEFIKELNDEFTISLAHSNATYDEAVKAFDLGIAHATHLFNQMNGLTHRAPGAVGAIFDSDKVTAEIICDGFHIHPASLRIAFKQLGEDRTCVISDSLMAAGCPDGMYELGGQPVTVKDGKAFMPDGAIAASTANLQLEFRNIISYGIPFRQAIKSCTINPAREIKADKEVGSIKEGKYADLQVVGEDYIAEMVFVKGKRIV
ncbi:MAG: N-acetylglucosamine-6-phosphate deacetylase [Clostridiales bacterium]|nr:N-acetylglucosamine-6-phosphate deacetylase [Clostridiales bacterium]